MEANVGGLDRVMRILIGLGLIAWVMFFSGPTLAWFGVVILATGLIRFCGAYRIFGVNTCKIK